MRFLLFSLVCLGCVALAISYSTSSILHKGVSRRDEKVCQDDFLIVTHADGSTDGILSTHGHNSSVELINKKATRQEMFRFEYSHNSPSQQWVIRTFDRSHLAIDSEGNLIVETGCVKTTFIRWVEQHHLGDCFRGLQCKMLLCATSTVTGKSFLVSPNNQVIHPIDPIDCTLHKFFSAKLKTLAWTTKTDLNSNRFNFLSATNHTDMIGQGLKQLCPKLYDPKREAQNDVCPSN